MTFSEPRVEENGRLALSPCYGGFMPQNNPKRALPITRPHRPAGPLPPTSGSPASQQSPAQRCSNTTSCFFTGCTEMRRGDGRKEGRAGIKKSRQSSGKNMKMGTGASAHHLCHPSLQSNLREAAGGLAGLCAALLLFDEGWDPPPTSNQSTVNDKGRPLRLH